MGLGKAKASFLKKFTLVQAGTATRVQAFAKAHGEDPMARALRSIETLGRKLHSTALISLAYRAASDPFSKVRSVIEDMIPSCRRRPRRRQPRRLSATRRLESLRPPTEE